MPNHTWPRLIKRFSKRKEILGIPCYVSFFNSKQEKKVIFEKLHDALQLIHQYSPVKFKQLTNDVKQILVFGIPTDRARFFQKYKLIELYRDYLRDPETSSEMLAATIVHEAQHARLFRLGFGYDMEVRAKVERICYMAQKIFGLRIPNGEAVVEYANNRLQGDIEYGYSDLAGIEADFKALDELGCSKWIQKLVRWYVKRKTT